MQEIFVVKSVESYFAKQGFIVKVKNVGYPDITCYKINIVDLWKIEAKGDTKNKTVDFHTALGQLARLMTGNTQQIRYAVALPDTPSYRAKCAKINDWFRSVHNLYWLLVRPDGSIRIVPPGQTV